MSEPWLSTHIERWPTEKLVPYARNARTHDEAQVAQIAGSIAEFGFVNPVLVGDDGTIVGNTVGRPDGCDTGLSVGTTVG